MPAETYAWVEYALAWLALMFLVGGSLDILSRYIQRSDTDLSIAERERRREAKQ